MRALVLRRALAQRRLLLGVVALVTVGTTFLGVCALLLGTTQQHAFTEGVQSVPSRDLEVDAFLVDVGGADISSVREQARQVLTDLLAPVGSSVTSTTQTTMRHLPEGLAGGLDGVGYLASVGDLTESAVLTSGHWPQPVAAGGPPEAVLPQAAADRLGVRPGDQLTLGAELSTGVGSEPVETPVALVVTGTFRPRSREAWSHDVLSGAGYDPAWSDGGVTSAAYGPFVVDDGALMDSGSRAASLQVTAHPVLDGARDAPLGRVASGIGSADGLLRSRVSDQVRLSRVASDLPATLGRIRVEQAATRSTVEVVLLLGVGAALTALLLAGRLVGAVRAGERRLLVSLGLGRTQLALATLSEALLLALVAGAVAVPAAAVLHSRLTHLPALAEAGLVQGPQLTAALVGSVLAGALLLALGLVVTVLAGGEPAEQHRRRWFVRLGGDVPLVLVAVAAWWELHADPPTPASSGDPLLTLAPVVGLLAASLLVARWVPALVGSVAARFDHSRGLVRPLALVQAARQPRAVSALLLLTVAAAAATFGLTMRSTWQESQADQAALRVGTDLALTLSSPATAADAGAVAKAAGTADVVSPVVDRTLALGRYVGDVGSAPLMVAVDSRRADSLLRGRPDDGDTWDALGADLAPGPAVTGTPMPAEGEGVTLTGRVTLGASLVVTPILVLQDPTGFRTSVEAAPVSLDGRAHPLRWRDPVGEDSTLIALRLQVTVDPGRPLPGADGSATGSLDATVDLSVPGSPPAAGSSVPWEVRVLDRGESPVRGARITEEPSGSGTVVRTTVQLAPEFLAYVDAQLLATTFVAPEKVPVVVSRELADAVGAKVGGTLSATLAGVDLKLAVVGVVATVPSAPGRVAVLADVDTLSRTLLATGSLDPVVDGWWVGDPPRGTAAALRALDLGQVTTRAGTTAQLARGPLRVTIPTALMVLVIAAVVLVLAGTGLMLGADQRRRSSDVARLRALGMSRPDTWRLLLVEHTAVVVPLVVLGTLVGALGAFTLAPALVRSDAGTAPVPAAVVSWPWAAEAGLVGGLLLSCLLVTVLVTRRQVRLADPSRVGGEA